MIDEEKYFLEKNVFLDFSTKKSVSQTEQMHKTNSIYKDGDIWIAGH